MPRPTRRLPSRSEPDDDQSKTSAPPTRGISKAPSSSTCSCWRSDSVPIELDPGLGGKAQAECFYSPGANAPTRSEPTSADLAAVARTDDASAPAQTRQGATQMSTWLASTLTSASAMRTLRSACFRLRTVVSGDQGSGGIDAEHLRETARVSRYQHELTARHVINYG